MPLDHSKDAAKIPSIRYRVADRTWARPGDLRGTSHRLFSGKTQRAASRRGLDGYMPEASLLVVEDDPNILELLSASLRFAGFEVRAATSGSSALAAAAQQRPDLVVLDVMLPDVDGFDVIKRLRDRKSDV